MNRWQASIPADKISIFSPVSLTNLSLKLQFCMKKAAMKLSSLPLKMSVSYRNRTYNRVLGGPRYIHLTKETNAVFSGFSALLAPAAISMNSITLVMNFYCILFWHSGQSLSESNSDLSLSNFHKSQPWLNLRRRLLYPFNYENKCRIFKLFSLFRLRWPSLWTQSLLWWIICFLISTFLYATVQIELLVTAFYSLTALTMVMS